MPREDSRTPEQLADARKEVVKLCLISSYQEKRKENVEEGKARGAPRWRAAWQKRVWCPAEHRVGHNQQQAFATRKANSALGCTGQSVAGHGR